MAHAVDNSGFPLDPELRCLEDRLGDLAAEWRGVVEQSERASAIIHEYHATMERLIEMGWDASVAELDYEDLLPDNIMPEVYLRRHDHLVLPSGTRD